MSLPAIAIAVMVVLLLGYRFYGRLIARQYNLGTTADTPAHRHRDDVDFVPTQPFYLFGQHFSAIAAAGPIVGPILATQQFGWMPAILWIVVGVVFIGAVHDFTTLVASVRHDAKSIAEVAKVNLGRRAWLAMLAFIWLALVYVIVAFVDVTAGAFTTRAQPGIVATFDQGGAVALAGVLYLGLALLAIAVWLKRQGRPIWYVVGPMVLVMAVTVTALVLQARALDQHAIGSAPWINGLVSAVLLALAGLLVVYAVRAWRVPARVA